MDRDALVVVGTMEGIAGADLELREAPGEWSIREIVRTSATGR